MSSFSFQPQDVLEKVASCYGTFQDFPSQTPNKAVPDGPLFGNGDLGIVVGADKQSLRFYLSKNDLWCATVEQYGGGVKSLGFLEMQLDSPTKSFLLRRTEDRTCRSFDNFTISRRG